MRRRGWQGTGGSGTETEERRRRSSKGGGQASPVGGGSRGGGGLGLAKRCLFSFTLIIKNNIVKNCIFILVLSTASSFTRSKLAGMATAGILLGDNIYVSMYYRTKTWMILYLFFGDKTYIFRSVGCTVISKSPPRVLGVTKPRFNTYFGFRDVHVTHAQPTKKEMAPKLVYLKSASMQLIPRSTQMNCHQYILSPLRHHSEERRKKFQKQSMMLL